MRCCCSERYPNAPPPAKKLHPPHARSWNDTRGYCRPRPPPRPVLVRLQCCQGLTLVHISAQLEPCVSQESTLHTLNTP
jgi:hypothetical protein